MQTRTSAKLFFILGMLALQHKSTEAGIVLLRDGGDSNVTATGTGMADSSVTITATGSSKPGTAGTTLTLTSSSGSGAVGNNFDATDSAGVSGYVSSHGNASLVAAADNITANAVITDSSKGTGSGAISASTNGTARSDTSITGDGSGAASSSVSAGGNVTSENGGALTIVIGSATFDAPNILNWNNPSGVSITSGGVGAESFANIEGSGDEVDATVSQSNSAEGSGTGDISID